MAKIAESYLELDVYQASLTPTKLSQVRRTLAKRANQRLLRLERATSNVTGERYSEIGAYPKAMSYLERTGRRRFDERSRTKMDYDEQRREVIELQAFLSSKTSTVQGIREIEQERIKTFGSGKWGSYQWTDQERRALQFASTKEFYEFLNSSIYKELKSSGFTSDQLIEVYDEARERYQGRDREVLLKLTEALDRFRAQGSISLKELREAAGGRNLGANH